jgi:tRNA threonylcarbamoyladenosine biosynthesis protein TsaB
MKVLAVDTATKSCSVAIVDKDTLLAEVSIISEQTHSKHLMNMISRAMGMSGLNINDLDGFAVIRGPGSFTGLRIGISSVKGLAIASGKPVVGISSLDALAMQSNFSPYLIFPLLDARKGEVYFSRYRFKNFLLKKEMEEQVLPPDKAVCNIKEPCIFIGNGAFLYREVILDRIGDFARFAFSFQNTIRASTVAYLGMDRLKNNDTDDVFTLVPKYIRKSDAELKLQKR